MKKLKIITITSVVLALSLAFVFTATAKNQKHEFKSVEPTKIATKKEQSNKEMDVAKSKNKTKEERQKAYDNVVALNDQREVELFNSQPKNQQEQDLLNKEGESLKAEAIELDIINKELNPVDQVTTLEKAYSGMKSLINEQISIFSQMKDEDSKNAVKDLNVDILVLAEMRKKIDSGEVKTEEEFRKEYAKAREKAEKKQENGTKK